MVKLTQGGETKNVLAFPVGGLTTLRAELMVAAPLETACFLLARPVRTPEGGWRLVVYETLQVSAEEYEVRTPVQVDLPPSVTARVMQRARPAGATVVVVHSHPFPGPLSPSDRDLSGERQLIPALHRRIPGVPHARLIIGPEGLHAALFNPDGTEEPLEVHEVGPDLVIHTSDRDWGSLEDDTHDRQVRAFGQAGQQRLARLTVGIVGLGGTGSVATQQLAHLGIGAFTLIDPDLVETTNMNRLVGARPADVGKSKVDVARAMILAINPSARVSALQADVRDSETAHRLLDTDIFLICTDSHGSRAVLTQLAYQYLVPGIDVGVAIHAGTSGVSHISGRVQMLAPGLPCLLCGGILDPEEVRRDLLTDEARAADTYIVGAPTPQPAVISINSAASSLAVTMLLAVTTGMPLATRHQRLRLETGVVSRLGGEADPGCPVCSASGALCRGDSWTRPGRVP